MRVSKARRNTSGFWLRLFSSLNRLFKRTFKGRQTRDPPRHVEALRLIGYNLEKLAHHIKVSRRILNDLRMLRRILHQEDRGNG